MNRPSWSLTLLQARSHQLRRLTSANSTAGISPPNRHPLRLQLRRPRLLPHGLSLSVSPNSSRTMTTGIRVAVEGCGHGTLNAIYASVAESCKARGWDGVDLLIIGGDFQAVRNAADLTVMSCPVKYRHLGDFPDYYSGARKAPYLTIFIAGNHEASSHLWELYYGGWVAPNIYYMGAANILRLGPVRIAGLSGIWKGHDYRKPHLERLPFSDEDVRSFYHVREIDVRKLLQVRTQVDVGLSHDWPRGIERHGDHEYLFQKKPAFRQESEEGTLGSAAAKRVMDRLRPPYWFSAHMHIKFPALKKYSEKPEGVEAPGEKGAQVPTQPVHESNPDEIDLDMEEEEDKPAQSSAAIGAPQDANAVSEELRAQLPASFAPKATHTPGQPVPSTIPNKEVRFLSLDKCLPGRHFLQLCEIEPFHKPAAAAADADASNPATPRETLKLQYDPEWLAIVRAFHPSLTFGVRHAPVPKDLGEAAYLPLIEKERLWVQQHIVDAGKLAVPENFAITAPPHEPGTPEIVKEGPLEYTSPQTAEFCELLGIENYWHATEEERRERRDRGVTWGHSSFGGGPRGGRGGSRGGGGNRGNRGGRGDGGRGRGGGRGDRGRSS